MKPLLSTPRTPPTQLAMCVALAALILSSVFCFADTCPSNTKATLLNEETLDFPYQPGPPNDPGILHRYRFVPPNADPDAKFPTVLMLPPDVFHLDFGDRGVSTELTATYDLQHANFLVFQVDHRIAPPNTLLGQATDGRAPNQTDDIKRQILAALNDHQCNGSIYLIGGSAGGTLALWCGLDSATGAVAGWDSSIRAKIKGVVSLSGVTDLNNWDHPGLTDAEYVDFETQVDNYVGLTYPDHTPGPLLAASPVNLITNGVTSGPPVKLYASTLDPVSHVQADEMFQALFNIGVPVTKTTFTGRDHAFYNWHKIDPSTGNCVSSDVISFLRSHP